MNNVERINLNLIQRKDKRHKIVVNVNCVINIDVKDNIQNERISMKF